MARMPKTGNITSPYGMRKHPITGVTKMHNGVDIGGTGTIVAPVGLTITHKGQNLDKQVGYGYWIRGRDANGKYHMFAHMQAPSNLYPGNQIPEGAVIGQAGQTGGATGNHLHWGVSSGVEAGWENPIAYLNSLSSSPAPSNPSDPDTIDRVAREVIAGKWGNGNDRKRRLEAAGYNYGVVQARVNSILSGASPAPAVDVDTLAREVIAGKWGNGDDRKKRLQAAGHDYAAVQARVNAILVQSAPAPSQSRTYTVKKGDSLYEIAQRNGVKGGWQALYNANRKVIGPNPNLIRVGQVLTLP